jgi:hypothetical protein
MKQLVYLLILLFCGINLRAQQGYFIAIDADDNQFFSVTIGKKNYRSSSIGHLVIPNLKDSTYQLLFSFPQSNYKDQVFSVTINKKDKGYSLKKDPAKGWSLVDRQANTSGSISQTTASDRIIKDTLKREPKPLEKNQVPVAKSNNAFARMMAAVVNDSAVLVITPVNKPLPPKKAVDSVSDHKPDINKELVVQKKSDSGSIAASSKSRDSVDAQIQKTTNANKTPTANRDSNTLAVQKTTQPAEAKTDSAGIVSAKADSMALKVKSLELEKDSAAKHTKPVDTKPPQQSFVLKIGERWLQTTKEISYIDSTEGEGSDTIKISIELDTSDRIVKQIGIDTGSMKLAPVPSVNDSLKVRASDSSVGAMKIADTSSITAKPVDTALTKSTVAPKKPELVNSDCRNFATENDLDKLRIKMLTESNLDERIQIARKFFRTKCVTTRQVRALTELFVNDKTRYAFFDAAYPFVSDSSNFKSLIDLLNEEYYINRFKAMVRM